MGLDNNEWVTLSYTLPREPSRVRVSVWRRLKKMGSVNLQQSLWIMPLSNENESLFSEIKDDIISNSGEAFIMRSTVDEENKKVIMEKFNTARDEEYLELIEQCEDFFKEIDKEIGRKNFSFAEIEENEEELNKLKKWYEKILARDFYSAPLNEKSVEMLKRCEKDLDRFCDKVYEFTEKA